MLKIVYWDSDRMTASEETAINQATLIGTLIGQVLFGVLADRFGRKHLYGYELIIIIGATVCMALASKGALDSISLLPWLITWRLFMGIGIGMTAIISIYLG